MSEKPSLHEIAAMPFPASMEAMRKHYNPNWHKPEGDGPIRPFKVAVEYTYEVTDSRNYEVVATDAEDAERAAMEAFEADRTVQGDMIDVVKVDACEVSQ